MQYLLFLEPVLYAFLFTMGLLFCAFKLVDVRTEIMSGKLNILNGIQLGCLIIAILIEMLGISTCALWIIHIEVAHIH